MTKDRVRTLVMYPLLAFAIVFLIVLLLLEVTTGEAFVIVGVPTLVLLVNNLFILFIG